MDVGIHGVRQILGDALQHPQDIVQLAAVSALAKHASVYEFDALFDLCTRSIPSVQREIVAALHTADPRRLEDALTAELLEPGLETAWLSAAALMGPCAPGTAERFEELAREAPPGVLPYYAACRALHGDEEALARLRELLRSENPTERSTAGRALKNQGLVDELTAMLEDPDSSLRIFALEALAEAGRTDARQAAVSACLGDASARVRRVALTILVGWGDPAARDGALEGLKGDAAEFRTALIALGNGWNDDPELARRALDILVALRDERAHRGQEELARVENGIARVPLPEAAEYLLELGRAYPLRSRGARSEMRNHRHFALKAGQPGRERLAEQWAAELDPLHRMDLVEALPFGQTEDERGATRDFLIGILRSDRVHPFEQLQASMRLARIGPTEIVAPILKRATLDVTHPDVRRGMQCLLWDWYG